MSVFWACDKPPIPEAAQAPARALGLNPNLGFTRNDENRAFRKRAFATHPDKQSQADGEAFISAVSNHQTVIRECSKRTIDEFITDEDAAFLFQVMRSHYKKEYVSRADNAKADGLLASMHDAIDTLEDSAHATSSDDDSASDIVNEVNREVRSFKPAYVERAKTIKASVEQQQALQFKERTELKLPPAQQQNAGPTDFEVAMAVQQELDADARRENTEEIRAIEKQRAQDARVAKHQREELIMQNEKIIKALKAAEMRDMDKAERDKLAKQTLDHIEAQVEKTGKEVEKTGKIVENVDNNVKKTLDGVNEMKSSMEVSIWDVFDSYAAYLIAPGGKTNGGYAQARVSHMVDSARDIVRGGETSMFRAHAFKRMLVDAAKLGIATAAWLPFMWKFTFGYSCIKRLGESKTPAVFFYLVVGIAIYGSEETINQFIKGPVGDVNDAVEHYTIGIAGKVYRFAFDNVSIVRFAANAVITALAGIIKLALDLLIYVMGFIKINTGLGYHLNGGDAAPRLNGWKDYVDNRATEWLFQVRKMIEENEVLSETAGGPSVFVPPGEVDAGVSEIARILEQPGYAAPKGNPVMETVLLLSVSYNIIQYIAIRKLKNFQRTHGLEANTER